MKNGKWRMENEEWRMKNGEWRMENGEWRMENGEWRMKNGEWRMENGKLISTFHQLAMTEAEDEDAGRKFRLPETTASACLYILFMDGENLP